MPSTSVPAPLRRPSRISELWMISTMTAPSMRLGDRAAAAAEADAAEHGGGQGSDFEADARVGAGSAEAGRIEHARHARQHARDDIGMQTVRRTEMPALCAERREPPTARMCQPSRRRVRKTWAAMATIVATMKLNGKPNTSRRP